MKHIEIFVKILKTWLETLLKNDNVSRLAKRHYILIRYPTQTNIKHLSCNKQPQLGCVNTSRVRPSLLCLHKQNGWKQYNKQNENSEMHKITARKTIQQNDLNYARITINQ